VISASGQFDDVRTIADLAKVLRELRRREARTRGDTQLTYRELAAKTGWAHGVIGDYFAGKTLPPTDRFDVLVTLLGANPSELGALATARDRVEEHRRQPSRPTAAPPRVPRELPRQVSTFVGRTDQLVALDGFLDTPAQQVVISAVAGTAGVGKTALAVQWAHRVSKRFPDGCLYVDLRGYGPDQPVRPVEALTGFLRSLGVSGVDLPPGQAELAARYRTMLADRRMLILLDNARSADQVRPLLPGTSSSFVLVTSRDQLTGLVARDGASRIDLDRLPAADAIALLRALIGPRADAANVVAELAERCARLPLGLRIAAELAAARPGASLAELVAELGETPRRLDLFDAGGDPDSDVREIFSWSYRHLSQEAARTFRLLGLHPGSDWDLPATAALTGDDDAARCAVELVRAHLLEQTRGGRYAMHDLLRAYAAERVAEETEAARLAATRRLFDHYVQTAAADPERAWLDAELPNLVAMAKSEVDPSLPDYAGQLSGILWSYLDTGGHYVDAVTVHSRARQVAEERGDPAGVGAALGELGLVYGRVGRYDEALDHLHRALAVNAEPLREARAHNSLAQVYARLGQFTDALDHLRAAHALYHETGDRVREGKVLNNLGIVYTQLGRYPEALDHYGRALSVAGTAGDRSGEADALTNLGLLNIRRGEYRDALRHHRQGLAIARELGSRRAEGLILANLGIAHTKLDQEVEALECFRQALDAHRDCGDRAAEAETQTYLAHLHHRAGRYPQALQWHEAALTTATEIGERTVQADALTGIGDCLHASGNTHEARKRWEQALSIYVELGVPDAERVRERLGHP
jgi:tetratricopeptide (TPR) repeat protein